VKESGDLRTARAATQSAPRRAPGRPARLSREAFLAAALRLLEHRPGEPLTVACIAAEAGAAPAALYRHFAGLDELLDGVLGRVLGGVELQIRPGARWPEEVRDWMISLRAHLLRYPAALPLLGRHGRTSPAWLDAVSTLVGVLERGGLSGAELAYTQLWILETTVGLVMQEASFSFPEQIDNARAAIGEMSAAGRARLAPLFSHLAQLDGDAFFAFVCDRTIAALVARAGSR
jgi:AcrR family transcriptional regulator